MILLAAALFVFTASESAAQNPVYRSRVDRVVVYPTVMSKSGRRATGLQASDFVITDNGIRVAVAEFSNDPQPLNVVMLLDMSESMTPHLTSVRNAAAAFIDALEAEDRLRLGTFGKEVALSPHSTSDKTILRRVLREETWPGGRTPLWQALDQAVTALADQTGRTVIVVITDGNDDSGWSKPAVLDRLRRSRLMVYALTLNGADLDREFREFLSKAGGAHVRVARGEALVRGMHAIADELRHQYMLGFAPTASDGAWHHLMVTVSKPGYTVKAPHGFEAPRK